MTFSHLERHRVKGIVFCGVCHDYDVLSLPSELRGVVVELERIGEKVYPISCMSHTGVASFGCYVILIMAFYRLLVLL